MQFILKQLYDGITRDLAAHQRAVRNRKSILQGMGLAAVNLTKRAFREPGLRPQPWAPLKSGGPATLIDRGTLRRSPRVISVSSSSVTIGSDRPYAAVQHLGNKSGSPLPPRPFFPFNRTGKPTRRLVKELDAVVKKRSNL